MSWRSLQENRQVLELAHAVLRRVIIGGSPFGRAPPTRQ